MPSETPPTGDRCDRARHERRRRHAAIARERSDRSDDHDDKQKNRRVGAWHQTNLSNRAGTSVIIARTGPTSI